VGYFILAAAAGTLTDALLKWQLKLKRYPCTVILSLITMIVLNKAFDDPLPVIKGFLFTQILIFAGYYDAKTKVIPDAVHVLIAIVSMINIDPIHAIIGLFTGLLPFLVIGIVNGGIGGGDIKFMGAAGLALGGWGVAMAGLIGLSLALFTTYIFCKDKTQSIPLAPYLGTGCFVVYCLQI
jgi:leader peptidase (prepilin peptidase) / N-methyltransferase